MTHSTSQSEFASYPLNVPVVNAPVKAALASEAPQSRHSDRKHERKSHRALPKLPATHVWGIDYSVVDMAQTLDFIDVLIERREPSYAITANVNFAMLCAKNPRLAAFTERCKLVLCDGMPILWRSKINKLRLPERVAGADLIYSLAQRGAECGYRIFLMGGGEGVALSVANKLREMHPRLIVAGVESPPFRPLSNDEHARLCQRIRNSKPDILLIAFGQPKGELWIEENYQALGVPLCIQLGASFDFITGKAKRAPRWIQRIGMEWLFRALSDPRRLLPRYAENGWFLLKAIRSELLSATR